MNAKDIFLEQIGTIDSIVSYICRRNRLAHHEAEDFGSFVKEKLIENNYEVIRKFEERAAISTYLTTVIQHLFYQCRVRMWGKWRPSAEAKRLGDKAIALERLMYRDGLSRAEAVQMLMTGNDGEYTRGELEAIWLRLPIRMPRPVLVVQAILPDAAVETDADDRLMANDRQELARAVAHNMDERIRRMPAEDQLMLKMRYWDGWKVPQIAQSLGMDPKKVYKRLEKLSAILRAQLEGKGMSRETIADLLAHDDSEIHLEQPHHVEEKSESRPSNHADGVGGGASRLSR